MPRNGSGTYSLPQPPFVAGTVISSAAVNSDLSDIAAALTGSLPRDGQAGMTGQMKAVDGSTVAPAYAFTNDLQTGFFRPGNGEIGVVISGEQVGLFDENGYEGMVKAGVPIGSTMDFAGVTLPTAWLFCTGQAISRTTYPDLFTAIGVAWGSGDGATTFNVPDLRGTVVFGADAMGGASAASRLTATFFGTDPTVVGNRSNTVQSITLSTGNIPSLSFSGTTGSENANHVHAGVITGATQLMAAAGSSFFVVQAVTGGSSGIENTTHQHGFSGTTGGSATPFSSIPPAVVMSKIIYAGV